MCVIYFRRKGALPAQLCCQNIDLRFWYWHKGTLLAPLQFDLAIPHTSSTTLVVVQFAEASTLVLELLWVLINRSPFPSFSLLLLACSNLPLLPCFPYLLPGLPCTSLPSPSLAKPLRVVGLGDGKPQ